MNLGELLTLADKKPLLTDADLSAEEKAKYASSCRFYVCVSLIFAALWLFLIVFQLIRNRNDDVWLWGTFLVGGLSSVFFAGKYYLLMRSYQA